MTQEEQENQQLKKLNQTLDQESKEVLKSIYKRNGKANITQIRKDTGIKKKKLNYRFKNTLPDKNLIKQDYDQTPNDRDPPKLAILTEKGEKYCKQHLTNNQNETGEKQFIKENEIVIPEEKLQQIEKDIEQLKNKNRVIDATSFNPDFNPQEFKQQVETLLQKLENNPHQSNQNTQNPPTQQEIQNLKQEIRQTKEIFDSWTDSIQLYQKAFMKIFQRRMGINVDQFIKEKMEEQHPNNNNQNNNNQNNTQN